MMYQVILVREAEKKISKIPKSHLAMILKTLHGLKENPLAGKPLQGEFKGYYSLRAWPFRIIYRIEKKQLVVFVISIVHRKDVYR